MLDRLQGTMQSSTLLHGLRVFGDRWTAQILMGAFIGLRRFEDWHEREGIPRPTLSDRLRTLVELGILRLHPYQERPLRHEYRLTQKGLGMYGSVLMIWDWEMRWGSRQAELPRTLHHRSCGHAFRPQLACHHCGQGVGLKDLQFEMQVNPRLLVAQGQGLRGPRISSADGLRLQLGLRLDRWALMIITSVMLGCHHFTEISHVLRIAPGILTRRLGDMLQVGLLTCENDREDARRRVYRLTDSSRDLFGYLVCLSSWAGREHLKEPSSVLPRHRACGHDYQPAVVCDHCHEVLQPWEVSPHPLVEVPA